MSVNELALIKSGVVDVVTNKVMAFIEAGELQLPANYSPHNALKSAWLTLQNTKNKAEVPVLQACTKDSIANSLLDMVVQGLNPAKKQCYFIAYGNQLICQRSYFGDMALVKRVRPDADMYFGVVYQGDDFEYVMERGRKRIKSHVQKIENIKPEAIVAAYCVIEGKEAELIHTEVMTFDQIKRSWQQSQTYKEGGSGPHQKFPDQMGLRTVIRRACKAVINSSSDDYLLLHHVNRSDEGVAEAEMDAEVMANANGEIIDVMPTSVEDAPSDSPAAPAAQAAATAPQPQPKGQGQVRPAQAKLDVTSPGY